MPDREGRLMEADLEHIEAGLAGTLRDIGCLCHPEDMRRLIAEVRRLRTEAEHLRMELKHADGGKAEFLAIVDRMRPADSTDGRHQGAAEACDRIAAAVRGRGD